MLDFLAGLLDADLVQVTIADVRSHVQWPRSSQKTTFQYFPSHPPTFKLCPPFLLQFPLRLGWEKVDKDNPPMNEHTQPFIQSSWPVANLCINRHSVQKKLL